MADSMRALSSASPTLPTEPLMPASRRASVNASDVYCEPASVMDQPGGGECRVAAATGEQRLLEHRGHQVDGL